MFYLIFIFLVKLKVGEFLLFVCQPTCFKACAGVWLQVHIAEVETDFNGFERYFCLIIGFSFCTFSCSTHLTAFAPRCKTWCFTVHWKFSVISSSVHIWLNLLFTVTFEAFFVDVTSSCSCWSFKFLIESNMWFNMNVEMCNLCNLNVFLLKCMFFFLTFSFYKGKSLKFFFFSFGLFWILWTESMRKTLVDHSYAVMICISTLKIWAII